MTPNAAHAPLDIDALRRMRAQARLGHTIRYFESIGSTSDEARDQGAAGIAEGLVVIAETQTRGRGRLGRRWASPAYSNLYMSVLLRPAMAAEDTPQIGLMAGLATAEAVAAWVPQARIKWPNDVVIDGRKVAGILTEMTAGADGSVAVVAGIGVNLNIAVEELPVELRDKATSLAAVSGTSIDRVAFANALLSRLEQRYEELCSAGFAPLRQRWDELSCLTGRHVRIAGAGAAQEGTVIGMAGDGALRLRSADGIEMRVVAGDVTVLDGYGSSATGS
jgi:BirA family biotin operon repressor/biotin-[acetyl-CoA-carboxylase] ligase